MRHTISVLVENKFGVLTRIAGMFSGRGFNIDTLNVGPTLDPSTSRMTIVVRGDDTVLEQIIKQLNKLVDVIEIQDFREDEYVDRELVLMRVRVDCRDARRSDADLRYFPREDHRRAAARTFPSRSPGNESKIKKFLDAHGTVWISDLTRTGKVALAAQSSDLQPNYYACKNLHRQRRRSERLKGKTLRGPRLWLPRATRTRSTCRTPA